MKKATLKMSKSKALRLILLFGLVSLFGDIVYEAARSINGQYLQALGASVAIVGLVAGVGEFVGYSLRLLTGYFSDRTKAYWFFTILGYCLLASVPALALAGIWQLAAFFIIAERIGKAFRNPARDTLMSQATKRVGTGWGFAVHEFLDQLGALAGPLLIAVSFGLGAESKTLLDYQQAYSLLWIPFIFLTFFLLAAYFLYRNQKFEKRVKGKVESKIPAIFWSYLLFTFLTTLGFINFAILGYHFKATGILADAQIPLFYAAAMLFDAFFALLIGRMYDMLKTKMKSGNAGLLLLIVIPVLTFAVPLLAFVQNVALILVGILVWGAALGAHETIMRAVIADIIPVSKRGSAYGVFTAAYGFATLLGSTLLGFLYQYGFPVLSVFVAVTQLLAIVVFTLVQTGSKTTKRCR